MEEYEVAVKFYAREIAEELRYAEEMQATNESEYTKIQAKITAYNRIMEMILEAG